MKKQLIFIGIIITLLIAGLSGCTENGENGETGTKTKEKITYMNMETNKIYVINADGTNEKYIGTGKYPKWSSDGNKIVYHWENKVHVINPDGSFDTTIYNSSQYGPGNIKGCGWVPKQDIIYVVLGRTIYFISPDGSGSISNTTYNSIYWPIFSSDGKKIAYCDNGSTYSINLDGTDNTLLAENLCGEWVGLSPDWKKIAYINISENLLYIIDINGANKITLDADLICGWSPDSSKIAYLNTSEGLYTVNADGTDNIFIKKFDCAYINGGISWSADSKRFAFNCGGTIYIINADGSGLTSLVSGNVNYPQWSLS